MRRRMRLLIEENGDLFFTALFVGAKKMIHIICRSNLSLQEKIEEVNRVCKLVMRFDSGSFNEEDALEIWSVLGAVPPHHPANFVVDQIRR